jgi:hypothetical protein
MGAESDQRALLSPHYAFVVQWEVAAREHATEADA